MNERHRIGAAGEHLVCADLLLAGYPASLAPAGSSYDVVVDVNGRLLRVQVKATERPREFAARPSDYRRGFCAYAFTVSMRTSASSRRRYDTDAFDVAALVALDTRQIGYLSRSELGSTVLLRAPGTDGYGAARDFDALPFARAAAAAAESA